MGAVAFAPPIFRHVDEPAAKALQALVERIAARIGRVLERRGLVERGSEDVWLAADAAGSGPLDDLLGHSITYRIVVGPRAGQKLFTLQTVPARLHGLEGDHNGSARAVGFSLHAGIDIQPGQRAKLERQGQEGGWNFLSAGTSSVCLPPLRPMPLHPLGHFGLLRCGHLRPLFAWLGISAAIAGCADDLVFFGPHPACSASDGFHRLIAALPSCETVTVSK